ncbi:hypothetical protein [Actinokineospora cianjurensis]|uniref:ATP synthase protein I n=1 Tax=Actinokineospora cianjurensis TaxID=585224 RepID=A0A421BAE2_9PSEU|nr:hypothetical protein [Actinokineospora cianjurensis]RLK61401.1 hypothetical protein CLV68_1941 [Actinokineospora cianjurensis]
MSEHNPDTDGQTGTDTTTASTVPSTHAESQLLLADQMWRGARWPVVGAWVVGVVAWTVVGGVAGLWSSVIGGTVAALSGWGTLVLMRRTVGLNVQLLMAAVLGGFVAKMFVLLITLVLVRAIPGVHIYALATTMLAVVLVSAIAETAVFRRTKIPTLILPAQDQATGSTTEN